MRAGMLVVLLMAPAMVAADAAGSYSRGLEAARVEDWPAVQRHMEAAIREVPEPAQRARLPGLRGEPYVPHYYLGLAAFNQGDCRGARLQWNRSDVMAVVDRLPTLKGSVDSALTECTRRIAQIAPARPGDSPTSVAATPTTTPPPPPKTQTQPARTQPARIEGGVPQGLRTVLDAYLAGRYADVLRLDPATLPDARARAHGYLLRAAAREVLTRLDADGGGERALRDDIRAARRELPGLKVDSTLFSPRFRSRFEELAGN